MKQRVVRVNAYAEVEGITLYATDISIVLGVNSIPQAVLGVAPSVHSTGEKLTPDVHKDDFTSLYKKLSEYAIGRDKKCSVHLQKTTLRTERAGDGDVFDEIELKDWILAGVGLSRFGPNAAPYMRVIFQHPICNLTKTGSIYEIPRSDLAIKRALAVSKCRSFLGIVESVYGLMRKSDSSFYDAPGGEIAVQFRKALGVDEFNPRLYLDERIERLFLENALLERSRPRIAEAISRMVTPTESASSTWDMIVSVCGAQLLNIVQDNDHNYTKEKLIIEPIMPWKSPTIELSYEDCTSTGVPGEDPFRLCGVMAKKFTVTCGRVTLGCCRSGNANLTDKLFDVLYVPNGVTPKIADGRIMRTSSPAILNQAMNEDAPYGGNITSSDVMMIKSMISEFDNALKPYCRAVYEISLKSMVSNFVEMALIFRDVNGNMILPGNSCKLVGGDGAMYYGYITDVVHKASSMGGCSTQIKMSHVRDSEIPMSGDAPLVKDVNVNAAYE